LYKSSREIFAGQGGGMSMIPITAFLLERYSLRSLFIISMGSFLLGSLLLAWSPYFAVTLLGRVFQAASG